MAVNIRNFSPRLSDTPYPDFEVPEDQQAIWRYMDYRKFKSLIMDRALWFSRVDSFGDHFEGAIPLIEAKRFEEAQSRGSFPFLSYVYGARKNTAACCWHINSHESVAMWKLYVKSRNGIAIKSTYRALDTAFNYDAMNVLFQNTLGLKQVEFLIANIRYVDHFKDENTEGRLNVKKYFFQKYVGYKHENELRALIQNLVPIQEEGFLVPVDLEVLVDEIYISPNASKFLIRAVKSLLSRQELSKPINESKVARDSFYLRQVG